MSGCLEHTRHGSRNVVTEQSDCSIFLLVTIQTRGRANSHIWRAKQTPTGYRSMRRMCRSFITKSVQGSFYGPKFNGKNIGYTRDLRG